MIVLAEDAIKKAVGDWEEKRAVRGLSPLSEKSTK
jgi:hypothetical protein